MRAISLIIAPLGPRVYSGAATMRPAAVKVPAMNKESLLLKDY
jgi:hypothetical protein